ncbi:MAG: ABC transporter permease subunit, partial [Pseudomonadota bacterium]
MSDLLITFFGKPHGIVVFQLISATQFTIYLTLIAFIGGGILAAFVTFCRIAPSKNVQKISAGYVWLFQSTPLLMLLFLLGLGVPRLLGFDINEWVAAGLALIIYTSAYISEVWRGALASLPAGQWEGGKALGMSFLQTLTLIIIPQAFRLSIAPTVGFMVQIIKGQSAGQRCSALRVLYLQDDVADDMLRMIRGGFEALRVGDPAFLNTDVGPVIDEDAKSALERHIAQCEASDRPVQRIPLPDGSDAGCFVAPTIIEIDSILDLARENFGPVLHVCRFKAEDLM